MRKPERKVNAGAAESAQFPSRDRRPVGPARSARPVNLSACLEMAAKKSSENSNMFET
jgi:hypothetical protein